MANSSKALVVLDAIVASAPELFTFTHNGTNVNSMQTPGHVKLFAVILAALDALYPSEDAPAGG